MRRLIGLASGLAVALAAVTVGSATAVDIGLDDVAEGVVVSAEPAESPSGADCKNIWFRVRQFASAPANQRVFGQLCHRGELSADTPVQILIHGGSYNHAYWDWPYQPGKYSYVDAATKAGFATLNIDRLGYGHSDHPNPLTLDFNVAGFVTHQLVQALRSGEVGPKFRKVVLNGHSMGGLTAQHAASEFHDVDAVIVTGVGHNFAPKGIAQVADKFYPADIDPKFLGRGYPPGYLTTLPGNRAKTFVAPAKYDPKIEAYEERLKDTLSPTELTGITADSYNHSITRNIRVPVLYAIGQHDLIWCPTTQDCNTDPQARDEANYYRKGLYTRYVVPGSSHSINVTLAAPDFYRETFRWLAEQDIRP
ncbi:alpha/beta hydrolase [Pseudonocardia eucalypti]|uniref:Alpha/beta hydrolase n=1 Tax=Pseudonocardia eucalypti TaxID=648755 RepID=A0ABP9RFB9_9PSEU|nr:pimeloyl-ACP methyl ester carboxylesterase [Pseudonocardia eucalypti]